MQLQIYVAEVQVDVAEVQVDVAEVQVDVAYLSAVSYTHLTLPTIYSV